MSLAQVLHIILHLRNFLMTSYAVKSCVLCIYISMLKFLRVHMYICILLVLAYIFIVHNTVKWYVHMYNYVVYGM